MSVYRTILVPVDGSAPATRGLREAVRLAKAQRSRLVLLHVIIGDSSDALFATATFSPGVFAILREKGRRILERAAALAKRGGVASKAILVEKPGKAAAVAIVAQAKKLRADLIVLGTHGRRGIRRMVMGSDAEQVVRLAPVPVLLVRARPTRGR